jgi:hypothetical protein
MKARHHEITNTTTQRPANSEVEDNENDYVDKCRYPGKVQWLNNHREQYVLRATLTKPAAVRCLDMEKTGKSLSRIFSVVASTVS